MDSESAGNWMIYLKNSVLVRTVPAALMSHSVATVFSPYQVVWVHGHPVMVESGKCLVSVGPRVHG